MFQIKTNNNILLTNDKSEHKSQSHTFSDECYRFFKNNSLHAYRWMIEPERPISERILWIIIHIMGFCIVVIVFLFAWDNYTESPVYTSLYDPLYPVSKTPFPAIAICNNNRISKRAAEKFAKELSEKDPEHHNVTHFLNLIKFMGRLYDFDIDDQVTFISFQEFLDRYDVSDTIGGHDTSRTMEMLAPKCSDLLISCYWRGHQLPCMEDHRMHEFRKTQYGHCCTFNFVRPNSLNEKANQSYYIDDIGSQYGLTVLINASSDDYFYPFYSFQGFIISIFNPLDFPDMASGGVSEKIALIGTETFIRIGSSTLETEATTKAYSPEKRGCLFGDERFSEYGERYTHSDCIINCRIRNILGLCNCIPFYLPLTNLFRDINLGNEIFSKCTLEDIPCLNRYSPKWYTVLTKLEEFSGLEIDKEDGLYCPKCLPGCSQALYKVTSYSLPLLVSEKNDTNPLNNIEDISDLILLQVFLGSRETWLYKQSVALQWYEIISNLGGLGGVITGFSLITFVEFAYFMLRLIWLTYYHYSKNTLMTGNKINPKFYP